MHLYSKVILSTALAFAASGSFAKDIEKGTLAIGGNLELSYSTSETSFPNGYSFSTSVLSDTASMRYYVTDNFALGLAVQASMKTLKDATDKDVETSAMFFFQLHKDIPLSEKYNFFLQGDAGFGNGSAESNNVVTSTFDITGWDVTGGLSIFETEGYSISPYVSYGSVNMTFDDNSAQVAESTGLTFGFEITLYPELRK